MVQREFPQVRYIRQKPNRGPAAARNRGIKAATWEIIAFTDDDCVPPPNWLSSHLKYYDDQQVGCVGGLQLTAHPNFLEQFQMAHYLDVYTEFQRITRAEDVRGFGTNNLSVRREVFDRAGSFDEAFLTGSDPEFTRRVAMVGYTLIRDPNLRVEHLKVDTWRSYLRTRFRRSCGSVLTDTKYGTLSMRRFVPLVDPRSVWTIWSNFRKVRGVTYKGRDGLLFWTLILLSRVVDVASRFYYFWKIGHHYTPSPEALPTAVSEP